MATSSSGDLWWVSLIPEHTYTNRTFDLCTDQAELIWLAYGFMQPPTCRGRWIIDLWHNMEAQGVSFLLREFLSNRILTSWGTSLEAVTCPLWHPSGNLMLSWKRLWIFRTHISPLRWSREREGSTNCSFSTHLKRSHMLWNVNC